MGLHRHWGSCSKYETAPPTVVICKTCGSDPAVKPKREPPQNPNPEFYTLRRAERVGKFLLLMIRYHGCTNYEGDKILVFEDTDLTDLINQGSIDPHFCNNKKYKSPIARFIPTEKGWFMAKDFCKSMNDLGQIKKKDAFIKNSIVGEK